MHIFINEFDVNYHKRSVKRNNTFYFGKETVSIAFGSEKACLARANNSNGIKPA